MASADKLLYVEADGSLSFGDHTLTEKAKVEDFPYQGDLLKVKTYQTMTKLEKNGMFVYESVPGTAVNNFNVTNDGLTFDVETVTDTQITVELEEGTEYVMYIDGVNTGSMSTKLGGKMSLSVPASNGMTAIKIVKE